jgi:hypothetical protein
MRAVLRSDREKRFGHDLDPLKGGGARRHRSSSLAVRGNAPIRRSRFIRVS